MQAKGQAWQVAAEDSSPGTGSTAAGYGLDIEQDKGSRRQIHICLA